VKRDGLISRGSVEMSLLLLVDEFLRKVPTIGQGLGFAYLHDSNTTQIKHWQMQPHKCVQENGVHGRRLEIWWQGET
jgi:hypothetical protein